MAEWLSQRTPILKAKNYTPVERKSLATNVIHQQAWIRKCPTVFTKRKQIMKGLLVLYAHLGKHKRAVSGWEMEDGCPRPAPASCYHRETTAMIQIRPSHFWCEQLVLIFLSC